ncbi:protein of unknown function [Pararobbsia alpina]
MSEKTRMWVTELIVAVLASAGTLLWVYFRYGWPFKAG